MNATSFVDHTIKWYESNLLMINAKKTNLWFYQFKLSDHNLPKIKVGNDDTDYVNQLKYLGVIIDSKLSFSYHLSRIISKITHKLILFQQIRPFLNIDSSKRFYINYIRPLLEYCPVLLCSLSKTQAIQIEKLQNKALRIVTNQDYSNSSSMIRQYLNIPTLESRRTALLLIKTFDIINGNITSLKYTNLKINSPPRLLRSDKNAIYVSLNLIK